MKALRLILPVLPVLTLSFAASAHAADVNTYRPGQVYAATHAQNAGICEMQCSGTAQCYGWNFLRSGNPNGSGMCELNATSAAAVGHPYAISGDNGGRTLGASNIVQGQSRTFRIGNPEAARPVMRPAPRPVVQAAPQRRPVTAPVIRKRTFAPSGQTQAQARPQAPARPAAPQTRQAAASNPANLTLTQQQALQIAAKEKKAASAAQARPAAPQARLQQASVPRRPVAPARPAYGQPHPAAQMQQPMERPMQPRPQMQMPARPQQAPMPQMQQRPAGYPQAPQAPRAQAPMPQAPRPQAPQPSPQPNLYGSLYDIPVAKGPSSGQVMTALGNRMNRAKAKAAAKSPTPPLYSQRTPVSPNAPVSTAAPVKPVQQSGLQMAGPAPQ